MRTALLVASLFLSSVAGAKGHEADHHTKDAEQALAENYMKPLNQACGGKFDAGFDWDTFRDDNRVEWDGAAWDRSCGDLFGALIKLCGNPAMKKKVQDAVKMIACENAGKGKRKLTLAKGQLTYQIDFHMLTFDYPENDQTYLMSTVKKLLGTAKKQAEIAVP